jgi:hypothetical protein
MLPLDLQRPAAFSIERSDQRLYQAIQQHDGSSPGRLHRCPCCLSLGASRRLSNDWHTQPFDELDLHRSARIALEAVKGLCRPEQASLDAWR